MPPSSEQRGSRDPPVFTAIAFVAPRRTHEDVVVVDDEDDVTSMITQPLMVDYGDYDEEEEDYSTEEEEEYDDDADATIVVTSPSKRAQQRRRGKETGAKHSPSGTSSCGHSASGCHGKFLTLGALTGFLIQVVSLGAYALMLVQYYNASGPDGTAAGPPGLPPPTFSFLPTSLVGGGEGQVPDDESSTASSSSSVMFTMDWFLFGLLSVLTQIDLIIYILIWIAFTCTMTRGGMEFLRFQVAAGAGAGGRHPPQKGGSGPAHQLKRRFVFVLGVYFLVGIVLGAFAAWTVIDVYLGFPIPFLPIVVTVAIDLVLCYLMVCCYDLGRKNRFSSRDDGDAQAMDVEEDDDEECVCC
jgi:hypothetical protein